jgi:hypothetical protein
MASRLPRSVLLALGLTAGCQDCGREHLGPCLSFVPEEPPPPDVGHCLSEELGPCLEYVPEEPPMDVCLSILPRERPEPPEPKPEPEPEPEPEGSLDAARRRVLARGVLPEDVAALLRRG